MVYKPTVTINVGNATTRWHHELKKREVARDVSTDADLAIDMRSLILIHPFLFLVF
jgi:hypothetical protein